MNSYTVRIDLQAEDNASPVFNRVERSIKQTETTTNNSGGAVDGLARKLGGLQDMAEKVGAAFAGMFVLQKASELNELGAQANKAELTFGQMTAQIGGANSVMASLRSETGGVVDDMALMQGANALLVTGLADTKRELVDYTELAVKLGGAMGQDASEAISNFNSAMLNVSYERLDALGISAGTVRARVKELNAEGMATEDAFQLAVLEQGRVAMERLGIAADASVTPLARVQTGFVNLGQDVGEMVNDTLNSAITSLDQIIQLGQVALNMHPEQQRQANNASVAEQAISAAARREAELYADAFETELSRREIALPDNFFSAGGFDELAQRVNGMMTAYADDVASGAFTTTDALAVSLGDMGVNLPYEEFERLAVAYETVNEQAQIYNSFMATASELNRFQAIQASQQADRITDGMTAAGELAQAETAAYWDAYAQYWAAGIVPQEQAQQELLERTARQMNPNYLSMPERIAQQQRLAEQERGWDAYTQLWRRNQSMFAQDAAEARREQEIEAAEMRQRMTDDAQADAQAFGEQFADIGRFVSDSDLSGLTDSFTSIQNAFDAGLIPEAEYDRLKGMADEAKRLNESLSTIDLSGIFGQTDGGIMGQVTDDVVQRMKAAGATDEQIAAVQREAGLASGRETQSSLAYQAQLDAIVTNVNPEDIPEAIANLDRLFQFAKEMDLSDNQLAALLSSPGAIGFTPGMGQSITVRPGDTVGGLAAQHNMTPQEFMQLTGVSDPRMLQPGTYNAGGWDMQAGAYDPAAAYAGMYGGIWGGAATVAGGPGSGVSDPAMMTENISTNMELAATNAETFTSNLSGAVTEAETIVTTLDAINATPYTARLNLELIDPTGLLAMLTSGALTIGGARDKGGRVTGADGRVGQRAGSTPTQN